MKRKIDRRYEIDGRDVREAVLQWLRMKDMQVPSYVANTPTCKYTHGGDGSVVIEWTEEGAVDP